MSKQKHLLNYDFFILLVHYVKAKTSFELRNFYIIEFTMSIND